MTRSLSWAVHFSSHRYLLTRNSTSQLSKMINQILLCLAVAWFTYGIVCFAIKYSDARRIGIPIVSSPVSQMNVFWIILQPILLPLLRRLPFGLGSFIRYNRRGWAFHDKCNMHLEFGDAWVHVTPSAN